MEAAWCYLIVAQHVSVIDWVVVDVVGRSGYVRVAERETDFPGVVYEGVCMHIAYFSRDVQLWRKQIKKKASY